MRIIFMGTPDFAVVSLQALSDAAHEIVLVLTQPDRPKGRGGALTMSPVKEWAIKHDVPVYQPERIRDPEAMEYLREYESDIGVVAAFGQILPKEVLDMPAHGCVNVHASLLPKYRGAAPIQWAILNGDEETGVTIMQMDVGLDDGDIISQEKIAISPDDTGGSLFDKLSELGGRLLVSTLSDIEKGVAVRTPQDGDKATKVGMIKKDLGKLDLSKSAVVLERYIRGLSPWPGTYTNLGSDTIKIHRAFVLSSNSEVDLSGARPGEILSAKNEYSQLLSAGERDKVILVMTGDGVLAITELQLQGKKRMSAADFLRGHKLGPDTILG